MPISIPSHGNPEKKVFGLIGQSINTDESAVYSKRDGDKLNIGWENIVPSQTPSSTSTPTPTVSPTRTPTPTPEPSIAITPTPTITPTVTPTPTTTRTPTPTVSVTPSPTGTPGTSPTATPTVTPTSSPPAGTPPVTPTTTPTPTVTLSSGASPTSTPTQTPTVTFTPTNTSTPTPTPTPTATPTSSPPAIRTLSVNSFISILGPSGQNPGGTGPSGAGSYVNGVFVNSEITPDTNTDGTFYLDGVVQGSIDGTNTFSKLILMDANHLAEAVWAWKNVQWNMGILGGGGGTANGPDGTSGPGNVKKLATINITAIIDPGNTFVGWSCLEGGATFGSTTSTSTTATLTTDGAHSIRATILKNSYIIDGQRNDDGLLHFTYYDYLGVAQEYYNLDTLSPGGYVSNAACGTSVIESLDGSYASLSVITC